MKALGTLGKVLSKLVCSLLVVVISYCFAVNLSGVVTLAVGRKDGTVLAYVLTVVISLICLVGYWSGRVSTRGLREIRNLEIAVYVVFGGTVLSGLLYMLLVGEVLRVMLFSMVTIWVMMFAALSVIKSIKKNLTAVESESTSDTETSGE